MTVIYLLANAVPKTLAAVYQQPYHKKVSDNEHLARYRTLPKGGYATLITRNAEPPPAPSGLSSGQDTIRHR